MGFCTVTLVKIRVLVAMRYEKSTFNPLNLSEFASRTTNSRRFATHLFKASAFKQTTTH